MLVVKTTMKNIRPKDFYLKIRKNKTFNVFFKTKSSHYFFIFILFNILKFNFGEISRKI
jgi:hypothetical protein